MSSPKISLISFIFSHARECEMCRIVIVCISQIVMQAGIISGDHCHLFVCIPVHTVCLLKKFGHLVVRVVYIVWEHVPTSLHILGPGSSYMWFADIFFLFSRNYLTHLYGMNVSTKVYIYFLINFLRQSLCSLSWLSSPCSLSILLPQRLRCWDYRYVPPGSAWNGLRNS